MTKDDKAEEVLALLVGAIPCPGCRRIMTIVVLTQDVSGNAMQGWECRECAIATCCVWTIS